MGLPIRGEEEEIKRPPYTTVGDIKRFIIKHNIRDDAPVYVKANIGGGPISVLAHNIILGYNDGIELELLNKEEL